MVVPRLCQYVQESVATVPPFSATLVSLAALGDSDARIVLQLPHGARMLEPHRKDILQSAMNLHKGDDGQLKVIEVDALQSLRDAKTQCAVSPGAAPSCLLMCAHVSHILTPWHCYSMAPP